MDLLRRLTVYSVALPNISDEVSERTSEVVEVRKLSTTKNDYDNNHWEKLCKVLRVNEVYLKLNMILSRVRLVSLRYTKVQC